MHDRSRFPTFRSAAVTGALLLFATAVSVPAQVRLAVRESMQLRGNRDWNGSPDSGLWPIPINDFAAGDLDGDGDLDLVAAMNEPGCLFWRNRGDGSFREIGFALGASSGARCVALFDADGDSDLDVFLGGGRTAYEGDGWSALLRNDGLGNLAQSFTIPGELDPQHRHVVHDVGVGDLDGDGDRDLVLFTASNPRVHVWTNDGSGTFAEVTASAIPGGQVPSFGLRGCVADVDVDGDLDLLHSGVLYRNDGTGTFTQDPTWPGGYGQPVDVDGDGDMDLVDAGGILLNDGFGGFTAVGSMPTPPPYDPVRPLMDYNQVNVVDIDGDGLLDLVGTFWSSVPTLLRNTGSFVYQDVSSAWFDAAALHQGTVDTYWSASLAFDADGDGRPDLVTGGTEGRNAPVSTTVGVPPKLFLNAQDHMVDSGRATFPFLQATASAVAAGDLDGDGDVDLVFGYDGYYFTPTQHTTFLQDEAGRFTSTPALPDGPAGIHLADFDGDGDLDALKLAGGSPLWPGGWPGPHRLLLNDGAANFTEVTATNMPPTAVSSAAGCAVGDVDGDGDLDVVIGAFDGVSWSGDGEPLILLVNDGNAVFADASAQLPAILCQATQVYLEDFDGDGDRDLMVAGDYGHGLLDSGGFDIDSVFLFANDGTGHFTDVTATNLPAGLRTPGVLHDLDGDGDLDVAYGSFDLINDGAGVFAYVAHPIVPSFVDFDEDGVLDDAPVLAWSRPDGSTLLPVDVDRDGDLDLVAVPMHAFSDRYWAQLRVFVLYNLRRDVRFLTYPRLGQPLRLGLRASNAGAPTPVLPAVSIGRLSPALPLPGLGELQLDPATIVVLAFAVVPDAGTEVEVGLPIPNDTVFLGLPLCCQALFGNAPPGSASHLSNAITLPIER